MSVWRFAIASTLSSACATSRANDMPAMPDSYLQTIGLILRFGLPYSLVLYPALVVVPMYLIRKVAVRSQRGTHEPSDRIRARRWRNWTLMSLIPWLALAVWILFDVATNKSF